MSGIRSREERAGPRSVAPLKPRAPTAEPRVLTDRNRGGVESNDDVRIEFGPSVTRSSARPARGASGDRSGDRPGTRGRRSPRRGSPYRADPLEDRSARAFAEGTGRRSFRTEQRVRELGRSCFGTGGDPGGGRRAAASGRAGYRPDAPLRCSWSAPARRSRFPAGQASPPAFARLARLAPSPGGASAPGLELLLARLLGRNGPQSPGRGIEDLHRTAMVPVRVLGAAGPGQVLDDDVLVPGLDRSATAAAVVELLRDRANHPDLVALIGVTGKAAPPVGQSAQILDRPYSSVF